MAIAIRKQQSIRHQDEAASPADPVALRALADLDRLAGADIETTLVGDLGRNLREMFDPVSSATLPIYFGPLLGRLYLEGL